MPNADLWMRWLRERAASQGLLDARSLVAACGFTPDQLAGWAAASGNEPPELADILLVANVLQVDPYDLLVAAEWVDHGSLPDQTPEFRTDGNVTSFTWRGDPPTAMS